MPFLIKKTVYVCAKMHIYCVKCMKTWLEQCEKWGVLHIDFNVKKL